MSNHVQIINVKTILSILGFALLMGMVAPVFAEAAPVYDADSLEQMDTADREDLPPPSSDANRIGAMDRADSPIPPRGIEQRIRRVEQQIDNMQTNGASERLDALQSQIQALRGQVEELTHQLQQAQTQQKSAYEDLNTRLTELKSSKFTVSPGLHDGSVSKRPETLAQGKNDHKTVAAVKPITKPDVTSAVAPKEATSSVASQPDVAQEQQIYQTAYNLIKAKKYNDAVSALQGMLKKYPTGQFASNAHYWLGELYGLMGKHDQALTEFSTVVKTYPDSPRVSDAELKVGLIFAAQSKWRDAKMVFKKIINRYPGTASARLATEQLKQIKQAGH